MEHLFFVAIFEGDENFAEFGEIGVETESLADALVDEMSGVVAAANDGLVEELISGWGEVFDLASIGRGEDENAAVEGMGWAEDLAGTDGSGKGDDGIVGGLAMDLAEEGVGLNVGGKEAAFAFVNGRKLTGIADCKDAGFEGEEIFCDDGIDHRTFVNDDQIGVLCGGGFPDGEGRIVNEVGPASVYFCGELCKEIEVGTGGDFFADLVGFFGEHFFVKLVVIGDGVWCI